MTHTTPPGAPPSASTRRRVALAAGIFPPILAAAIVLASREPAALDTVAAPVVREAQADPSASDAILSAPEVEASSSGVVATARTEPKALAYPPPDIAVTEVIAQLDARARAGDAQAACRIAAELQRCRDIAMWSERWVDYEIERLARLSLDADTLAARSRDLDEATAYNAQAKRHCEGIAQAQIRRIPHYQLAAARAGHLPSMAEFAMGSQADAASLVADPPLYADYRAQAWPLFQRAFEAGEPAAGAFWWLLLGSGRPISPLAGLVPDDWRSPRVALALHLRLQRELAPDKPLPQPGEITDPPTEADIARAEELYARYFADSPHFDRLRSELAGAKPRDPSLPRRFEAPTRRCEDELD